MKSPKVQHFTSKVAVFWTQTSSLLKPWFRVKINYFKEFKTTAAVIGQPSYFFISGTVPS